MKKVKLLSGFMGILMGIMGACSVSASPIENSSSQKSSYVKVFKEGKKEFYEIMRGANSYIGECANSLTIIFACMGLAAKGLGLFCKRGSDDRKGFKKLSDEAFQEAGKYVTLALVAKWCS